MAYTRVRGFVEYTDSSGVQRLGVVASGQPCPTCGRRVPMTGAERQRKYAAKKKTLRMLDAIGAKMANVTEADIDVALNLDTKLS